MNVLFVCKGNMTRSQMAEAFFNQYAADADLHAESAGIVPGTIPEEPEGWELDAVPYLTHTIAVMRESGLDIAHNKTRKVTEAMAESADRIVIMAEKETVPDFLIHSSKVSYWDVANPGLDHEGALHARNVIERLVKELIHEISAHEII